MWAYSVGMTHLPKPMRSPDEEAVHVLRRPLVGREHVVERVADLGGEVQPLAQPEVVGEADLEAAAERREVVLRRARREQGGRVPVDAQVEVAAVRARLPRGGRERGARAPRCQRDGEDGAAIRPGQAGTDYGEKPPKGLDVRGRGVTQSRGQPASGTSFRRDHAT